jgi:putative transposase
LEDSQKVIVARLKTHANEKVISAVLKKEENLSISHRKVYELLKSAGLIHMLKKARRKKPWVRFQRKHSLSLWQTDWTRFEGKWLMVIMDDASRNVVSWGLFEHATTENSIAVLKKGIEAYGKPKAMLTGRDVQFYCSTKKGKSAGKNDFQKFLEVNGIQHILARVNHPQTCGKIERFFGEVKKRIHTWNDFNTIEEVVHWHNTIKPHMSLSDGEEMVTPQEAFQKKMHHNAKLIYSYKEVKENE